MPEDNLLTVNIARFPYKVLAANSRKPKYKNGKCTNKNLLNKPRFKTINTQKMYSGFNSPHERTMIVNGIKDDFRPKMQTQLPESLPTPLKIKLTMFDVPGNYDLDNRAWLYFKCFQDLVVEQEVIPDDNISYITANEYQFAPVTSAEDRLMRFSFYTNE